MSPSFYRTYFKSLAERYPLDVPVMLVLKQQVSYKGKSPRGLITAKDGKIKIQITVKNQTPLMIIKTIAHEYRHGIQWLKMNWFSSNPSDPAMESDANKFGTLEARAFYGVNFGKC